MICRYDFKCSFILDAVLIFAFAEADILRICEGPGWYFCKSHRLFISCIKYGNSIVKPLFSLLFTAWGSAYSTIKDKEYQDGQFIDVSNVQSQEPSCCYFYSLPEWLGIVPENQPPAQPTVCLELSRHSIHICLVVNIFFRPFDFVASIQLC